MSFLSKEEKQEWKSAKRFIKGETLGWLVFIVVILIVLSGVLWSLDLAKRKYVDKARINISRENFEQSKSRIHGLADDLAKYKYELATEKDPVIRKAIVENLKKKASGE